MPITSQHISMSYEEWDLLPYQPGWKYEYWDGQAHFTPHHQTAVTVVAVTPRHVHVPCEIRRIIPQDESALPAVYMEAFADDQAFRDYTAVQEGTCDHAAQYRMHAAMTMTAATPSLPGLRMHANSLELVLSADGVGVATGIGAAHQHP